MGSKKRRNRTDVYVRQQPDSDAQPRSGNKPSGPSALSLAMLLAETRVPVIDEEWEKMTPVGREFKFS
ncbi:hypothetical protein GIR22_09265 [Pseudomonas sp. CCM 7891]|uniref:Uncharacterized protein n=1 Tax=Pseudomonas karstica TaxID=1055468 RepID=A0A7X2UX15_9PSED|nr:hypothetical protein [Pseudomonas karstica]MTD19331.1 hypothetical protein [Pseudomonas karstica]